MKILSSICFGILFFCMINVVAQTTFTAYDRSSATAKDAWDQYYKNGTAPDVAAFDEKNPFDRSLKFLVAASMHIVADSTVKWTVASVLACRDHLDTLPFIIPVELQQRLSVNCKNGREQLLDGLMQLYYLAPWQCAYFIKEKEALCRQNSNEKILAFSLLNRALLYSEVLGKPERALPLIDSAIVIWTKLGDHSQLANNLKARGIVFLRMKKFREAEREIKSAMALYKKSDTQYGISSCQLDLVLIFAQSGEPDSMKKYDQLCRPGFEALDTMRLFVLNTNRLAAYQTANQYSIRDIAKQNAGLLFSSQFHPAMVIDYYKYSMKAFTFFGETALLKKYNSEYANMQQELLKQGYWPGLFK
ncbi:MAG TPA: tetratricopeptide repeat protein [Bacteroidales bacterium]|nr:tetratricopeptide repeat protein [Bacteroidales bacterium]